MNATQLQIGDQVYRKSDFGNGRSFYGYLGTIERLLTYRGGKMRAYVRWHSSMRLLGGTVDGHSTIALSSLVPATQERAQRLDEIKAEIRRKHEELTAMREAERVRQFQNAQPGLYWHIACPKTRRGVVSPARFQRFDPETGLHVFRCESHLCQEEHLVSDHTGAVVSKGEDSSKFMKAGG